MSIKGEMVNVKANAKLGVYAYDICKLCAASSYALLRKIFNGKTRAALIGEIGKTAKGILCYIYSLATTYSYNNFI